VPEFERTGHCTACLVFVGSAVSSRSSSGGAIVGGPKAYQRVLAARDCALSVGMREDAVVPPPAAFFYSVVVATQEKSVSIVGHFALGMVVLCLYLE